MSKPYDTTKHMTYVVAQQDGITFNPKLQADGKDLDLVSSSVFDEICLSRRLGQLLTKLIWDDHVTTDALNEIGFSKEDAANISIDIKGLENVNVPTNWEDEL